MGEREVVFKLSQPLYQILEKGTGMVPETSVIFNQLTRLIAGAEFINMRFIL
jgi:hypothetical protein